MNFLLSHMKAIDDATLKTALAAADGLLRAQSGGTPFTLTAARDDFLRNADRLGGWGDWMEDVLRGTIYATGKPRYDAFIAYGRVHGHGSGMLLHKAFTEVKKQVCVLEVVDGVWAFTAAWRVVQVSTDMKEGYRVE